jgi:hypothetical protein
MANLKNVTINDTGFLQIPVGTTAQRPTPVAGQFRYNTITGGVETYVAGLNIWQPAAARGVRAAGGTVYDVDVEGTTYRVHVFTATGNSTFTVTRPGTVEYLIVAGGGPGGAGNQNEGGGGGGAGGLLTGTTTVSPQNYTITVGAGGPGTTSTSVNSTNGQNSLALGLTAIGGGAGGSCSAASGNLGGSGGGGGGCGSGKPGGSGTAGQGNNGGRGQWTGDATNPENGNNGNGGGGGGAGSAGDSGFLRGGFSTGVGSIGGRGRGIVSNISGYSLMYAEGGNGGAGRSSHIGANATPNTGNGGGGSASGLLSGEGGSGIVIIRYPLQSEPDVAAPKAAGDGLVLDLDFAKPTVYNGNGTVVTDSRLNGTTGTLTNGPVFVDARTHRSAFNFNFSNAHIRFTGYQNSFNGFTSITLLTWVYMLNSSGYWDGLISTRVNTANGFTTFINPDMRVFFQFDGTDGQLAGGPTQLNLNQWYLVVGTYDGDRLRTYLNTNLEQTSGSVPGKVITSENVDVHVGAQHPIASHLQGYIAVAQIYNRALTANEISQYFNATRWRFGV